MRKVLAVLGVIAAFGLAVWLNLGTGYWNGLL